MTLGATRRTTHIAILGKTGSGKSSLLRSMAEQDIAAGRGFLWFDLHGDARPVSGSDARRDPFGRDSCVLPTVGGGCGDGDCVMRVPS